MESAVKMTAQGVRDLNYRGPKKKAAEVVGEEVQPDVTTDKVELPAGETAVAPIGATTAAVEG